VLCRSLQQNLATKEKNAPSEEVDPCQVCSTALGAFERTHGRTQGAAIEPRPSQPESHADALAGLSGYLRSTVYSTFDYK
jgi:hypothetical protein